MAFEGFEESVVTVDSKACGKIDIAVLKAGTGPPLVLLHGYPQTRYIYHRVADRLVDQGYTVIIPDLRGYGRSSKPKGSENHVEYSKREMAADIVAVAAHFGHKSFFLVAHDRGARVAHRLCLDHANVVQKLLVLDICPTLHMYENTDREFLLPNAEQMILGNPEAYFNTATRAYDFGAEARKDYLDHFSTPEGVHGSCEDYRAAAGIDLEHDREDLANGNKLAVQELRILWGSEGLIPKYGDVPGVWKGYCKDSVKVSGRAVPCGHYIPEAADEELFKEIIDFMR